MPKTETIADVVARANAAIEDVSTEVLDMVKSLEDELADFSKRLSGLRSRAEAMKSEAGESNLFNGDGGASGRVKMTSETYATLRTVATLELLSLARTPRTVAEWRYRLSFDTEGRNRYDNTDAQAARLSMLVTMGLLRGGAEPGTFETTESGAEHAGAVELGKPPLDYIAERLNPTELRIFEALAETLEDSLSRTDLAARASVKWGTSYTSQVMSRLRNDLGLIEYQAGGYIALVEPLRG